MGRQLIDDIFLNEWCNNLLDSTASSGGEGEYPEDDDYSRTPRGVPEPILTEVI